MGTVTSVKVLGLLEATPCIQRDLPLLQAWFFYCNFFNRSFAVGGWLVGFPNEVLMIEMLCKA